MAKAAKKPAKAPAPKATRGQQVAKVLALIEGGSSENAACLKVGINRATFRAAALREGAGDSYARALEGLAQDQVEKVEVCIDRMHAGEIKPDAARIEIEARKWFASKFLPKRYGDKVQVAGHDGGEFKAPGFVVLPVAAKPE